MNRIDTSIQRRTPWNEGNRHHHNTLILLVTAFVDGLVVGRDLRLFLLVGNAPCPLDAIAPTRSVPAYQARPRGATCRMRM